MKLNKKTLHFTSDVLDPIQWQIVIDEQDELGFTLVEKSYQQIPDYGDGMFKIKFKFITHR